MKDDSIVRAWDEACARLPDLYLQEWQTAYAKLRSWKKAHARIPANLRDDERNIYARRLCLAWDIDRKKV